MIEIEIGIAIEIEKKMGCINDASSISIPISTSINLSYMRLPWDAGPCNKNGPWGR
ncbi:hypothetical protein DSCO28_33970 [Desulfosarcina ovata subsp. sediminis]|uniref:Uncharacterized protein n=1 Tax=Desulfosarcina ovata subsp. sediminis TaxID=885957 RepID=A0A5K7ZNM5_9BACT|nr:hypothetical protein DSCO28_33970 [Desulfosarcina ovata subsp. sediminis]